MSKLIVVCASLLCLCSAPNVLGVVLLSDSFPYPNGPLVTGSGPWVHHSGSTTGEVQVVSGRAFLSQTNAEDVSVVLPGQPYPPTTNVLLYASFTVNCASLPSGAGEYFAHFKAAGTSGFAAKMFATTNGVASGFYRVGIANSANSPGAIINSNLSLNTDYTLVVRYAPSNATTMLWLNAWSETNSGALATDAGTTITVAGFALRESFSNPNGMGSLFIDNLTVGTSFADVASNSPPATPPGVLTGPQSQTVPEGSNVTFTVVAGGAAPLSYQWQFNGINLANATTSALALTNVSLAQSGDYTVTITNVAGLTNSSPATLAVDPSTPTPPQITSQPQSQTVTEGANVTLRVSAIGTQPLRYQWRFNGAELNGATNSTLMLANVTTNEAGPYSVAITNTAGSTNSQTATLTVQPAPIPPSIDEQPQSQIVSEGANVTIGVIASGTMPLNYRWRFEGTNLSGATNSILMLTNVSATQAGAYNVAVSNVAGSVTSQVATLTVNPTPPPAAALSYLTYNVKGNFATNWSTNAPQVQAIGHQIMYLNPDIITFNEIPNQYTYEMTNFVTAFLPGYYLATNSATDGFIRSVVASRFPILSSASHLHSADLAPFGYTNADFTRDLFEAQIAVPNFPQPLRVFTVHLKSGQGTDDSARRGAEASAISNYLVTVFLPTNLQPYLLSGDMNEDIDSPPSSHPQSIQRLINASTGLKLTTPVNPQTGSALTFSIQNTNGLNKRYDYVMPSGLLFSNMASSQVFRTDLLNNPPPPLLTNDDATASDHLPVLMVFGNPYVKPFRLTSIARSNQNLALTWESVFGQRYRIEASSNLTFWTVLANNLTATGATYTFSTNSAASAVSFFRVYRIP